MGPPAKGIGSAHRGRRDDGANDHSKNNRPVGVASNREDGHARVLARTRTESVGWNGFRSGR